MLARHYPSRSGGCRIAFLKRSIETRSLPTLARCCPHGFAFYVARPTRSIPSLATCSMSRLPSAPLYLAHSRSARPLPVAALPTMSRLPRRSIDALAPARLICYPHRLDRPSRSFPRLGSLAASLFAVNRDRLLQRHEGKNLKAEFT
jgi:hypothetical protein